MNKVMALLVAACSILVVACSGKDDDEASASTKNSASTASTIALADVCTGDVHCVMGDIARDLQLSKDNAGCHLGSFTLKADGTVFLEEELHGVRWTSTPTTLTLCEADDPDCIECVPMDAHR